MAQLRFPRTRPLPEVRYVRAPEPIVFPEEAEVPEGKRHLILRTFLFRLLRSALGPDHSVGSDQFVYWIASSPQHRLAPDAFVKLGVPDTVFGSWKTWERGGAPDLAVEIISPNEGDGVAWDEKLARYHALGVKELLRFDPEAPAGGRLRAWDRVREDLVERVIGAERTPCLTLGLNWLVSPIDDDAVGLRLADDEGRLLELPEESELRKRAEAEAARDAEARKRGEAEARVRELEDELRRARRG